MASEIPGPVWRMKSGMVWLEYVNVSHEGQVWPDDKAQRAGRALYSFWGRQAMRP